MEYDGMRFGLGPRHEQDLPGAQGRLERKFARFGSAEPVEGGVQISGYASLFDAADQSGDVVQSGAYTRSLKGLREAGRSVKMLWQHDPSEPIGIWDEVREDAKGLWVKGRILDSVAKGREAAALIAAGAIDGLSIGYRTVKASKTAKGQRLLAELELWEVSLVTFPMLPNARVGAKAEDRQSAADMRQMAGIFEGARRDLRRIRQRGIEENK
ncbi:HK97 family phage prohead protease [Sulfitobacter mediterraneus]|nr:HK97 family phage prohead protease [Sulfitobacter mediterraneus]MBM1569090.1 HK97 family phage prohead protease [Sulfitobacter mediterraneus]MBM1572517.1 HK97 family phage prohead protease [Sulfitobacter mediterraneus]MBM1576680.1 HK97 family phage prohead protease [Sulfitobacter mediterraneus]MBM1579863.1 HK97 family phage prohead protease [Sulfitobacter mediterraneus]